MEMNLLRTHKLSNATTGILDIGGVFQCYVCEDTVRDPGVKVPGRTAIPAGRYQVVVTDSVRFKRPLPLLLNVPMFEGIRIHPGNTAEDTEGCLLTGKARNTEAGTVSNSAAAFAALFVAIVKALAAEPVFITIQ